MPALDAPGPERGKRTAPRLDIGEQLLPGALASHGGSDRCAGVPSARGSADRSSIHPPDNHDFVTVTATASTGVDGLIGAQPSIARPPFHWPEENQATICSISLVETQQLRMLERLRAAGEQLVTIGELRGDGLDFPAVVIGELELHEYAIERVYEHGRLLGVRLNENEISNPPRYYADAGDGRGDHRDSHGRRAADSPSVLARAALGSSGSPAGGDRPAGA